MNKKLIDYPDVMLEWDYSNNFELDPKIIPPSSFCKPNWICKFGHKFTASVRHRIYTKTGCPYCAGKLVSEELSIAKTHSYLMKNWHNSNTINPLMVSKGSHLKINVICDNKHLYKTKIYDFCSGSGCPYCSGRLTTKENSLLMTHLEIAKQWHPTKNTIYTDQISAGSNKKIWWICEKYPDHIWQAAPYNRTQGKGCPFCLHKNQTKLYDIIKLILPHIDWQYNYLHPKLKYKNTNRKMQLDIFSPELKIAFEYQGIQHSKPIDFWGGKIAFEKLKQRDKEKQIACKENNIHLYEIQYLWKQDVEPIKEILSKHYSLD